MNIETAVRNKNRRTLIIISAVFLIPIILAFVLNATVDLWLPKLGTKNYGNLIEPAQPLQEVGLTKLDGTPYLSTEFKGRWSMVYLGSTQCDQVCEDALYKMRQSRLALNEELRRVHRTYILLDASPSPSFATVLEQHPGMDVVTGKHEALTRLTKQFNTLPKQTAHTAGQVYLIDPFGNIMMRYDKGFEAKGLVKDLKHLLRYAS